MTRGGRVDLRADGLAVAAQGSVALSVVIPVYNEEPTLPLLFARLYPALDALGIGYEIVFVNDGSADRSAQILAAQFEARPDVTRVVLFNGNFGQHRAILAGFEYSRGERVVTLDADLQNPPEDIAKLLAAMDRGHDYVGTIRRMRQDSYVLLNARLGFTGGDGAWEIAGWVRNLTDKFYITSAADLLGGFGFDYTHRGAPRTYGVEASYHF